MKIKQSPEDFCVEEVTSLGPQLEGPYAFYRLKKRGANTIDVLRDIARRLHRRLEEINYGGLKDRHALTTQYITIKSGPTHDLSGKNWRLEYLGRSPIPMTKAYLLGNRFRITVRSVKLSEEELERRLKEIKDFGLPNYYDDQRFGSARHGQGFMAKEAIAGNFPRALYLLLAQASKWDEKKVRRFRRCLSERWPEVGPCARLAPSRWEYQVVVFLGRGKLSKTRARKAFSLVDREFLLLLGQAYQSFIWNECLKEIMIRLGIDLYPQPYSVGTLFFYRRLDPEILLRLKELEIPTPSPKLKLEGLLAETMEAVLKREGFKGLTSFRTKAKGLVFKTIRRKALVFPEELRVEKRNSRITLSFFLPKGSYATVFLKRLFSH
ncbi:tRNA pseudouridine(13) synthase TruD [Thermosulfuriphilus sp.]